MTRPPSTDIVSWLCSTDGVYRLLQRYPGVFVCSLLFTVLLGIFWLWLLQKFARLIVYATLLINCVAFFAVRAFSQPSLNV